MEQPNEDVLNSIQEGGNEGVTESIRWQTTQYQEETQRAKKYREAFELHRQYDDDDDEEPQSSSWFGWNGNESHRSNDNNKGAESNNWRTTRNPTTRENNDMWSRRSGGRFQMVDHQNQKSKQSRKSLWSTTPHSSSKPIRNASDEKYDYLYKGSGLKFCPGDYCSLWLPLHQFASNYNMIDNFDTYCVECNQRRRKEHKDRRKRINPKSGCIIDSLEKFRFDMSVNKVNKHTRPGIKPKVIVMIERILQDAKTNQHLHLDTMVPVPITAETIYTKLFIGQRLFCEITQQPMTPRCFYEHHDITFDLMKGKRLDINCSHCSGPKSKKKKIN